MSCKSNDHGRAYEFAWMRSLLVAITPRRRVEVVENSSYEANNKAWGSISGDEKECYEASASYTLPRLLEMEPCIVENDGDALNLEFQPDGKGRDGDVRDLLLRREKINWVIGLSLKHNHDAVKHSRLSSGIDFGDEWYGVKCSQQYWQSVNPIFDLLKKEKEKGTYWSEIIDKEKLIYLPILNAFKDELVHACQKDSSVPSKLAQYLIGKYDYYKIISDDIGRRTYINTFNLNGTLNRASKTQKPAIVVSSVKLPNELVFIRLKPRSNTTVEAYFNNGWQLSFRIHNASSIVEPSLKFDIKLIGYPPGVQNWCCCWENVSE